MKNVDSTRLFRLAAVVAVLVLVAGSAPAAETRVGTLELDTVTAVSDILANPHAYEGQTVLVEGKVASVCTNMGCWLKLSAGDDRVLLARSTGDKILVPTDCVGRVARVEGVVVLEHEDEAPTHEGEEGHTCETASVRLETRGVLLGAAE